MGKKLIYIIFLSTIIISILVRCTPEQREHLNPVDPEYNNSNAGNDDSSDTYHTGVINFNSTSYQGTNVTATITLIDADLTASSITINVKSTSDSTGISITLTKGSGNYTGSLGFTRGLSSGSRIRVSNGDTITATYNDANPSGVRSATATWYTNIPVLITNFIVYDDNAQYPVSGYMGPSNGASLTSTIQSSDSPYNGSYCWKVVSNGSETWAGIYIQFKGNWRGSSSPPFANLNNYNTLVFYARSTNTITISEMGMGENSDSSGQHKLSSKVLTTNWQRFEIDLTSADLSSVNGLFYFSTTAGPYTIYFDNIYYTNK